MTAELGFVHGRFQPFHLGHLEYTLEALGHSDFLWVGITQPETAHLQSGPSQPSHRSLPEDNPLTYWERSTVIMASLAAEVDRGRFTVVPFPIERPGVLRDYVPLEATAFTTIYDDWNRRKIEVLREVGYTVQVLWEREEKEYAGSEVRRFMREGNPMWRKLVPVAGAAVLDNLGVPSRLLQ